MTDHVNDPCDKFWMVLGNGVPTYRHRTRASAIKEGERLPASPLLTDTDPEDALSDL